MSLFDELKNDNNFIHMEFSDYNEKELRKKVSEFQELIRNENRKIQNKNEQIIITNPFYFHKIVGCLHHYACEISGHKLGETKDIIAIFTGWDTSVLHNRG